MGNKRGERCCIEEHEKISKVGERSVVMTSGVFVAMRAFTQQYPVFS
jgi:hypothetical protein